MNKNGIRHETSVPDTPEQNGVAGRGNRTIVESARTILQSPDLPNSLWVEAVACAFYVKNPVLLSSSIEKLTPFEASRERKPDVFHFEVFGFDAFFHFMKERMEKFSAEAVKCKLVGYCETQKANRQSDPVSHIVRVGRDVFFDESLHTSTQHNPEDASVPETLDEIFCHVKLMMKKLMY